MLTRYPNDAYWCWRVQAVLLWPSSLWLCARPRGVAGLPWQGRIDASSPSEGSRGARWSGSVAFRARRASAGGEAHERGVEVDVAGGTVGAAGVAGELVLVARPGVVGDLLLDAGADHDRELGGGALDAGAELGGAPVLPRRVDGGREGGGADVGRQGPHLVVDDRGVARRAAGRRGEHGLGDDQVVVEDVDDGLEHAADARLVDGRRRGDRIGGREPV